MRSYYNYFIKVDNHVEINYKKLELVSEIQPNILKIEFGILPSIYKIEKEYQNVYEILNSQEILEFKKGYSEKIIEYKEIVKAEYDLIDKSISFDVLCKNLEVN